MRRNLTVSKIKLLQLHNNSRKRKTKPQSVKVYEAGKWVNVTFIKINSNND